MNNHWFIFLAFRCLTFVFQCECVCSCPRVTHVTGPAELERERGSQCAAALSTRTWVCSPSLLCAKESRWFDIVIMINFRDHKTNYRHNSEKSTTDGSEFKISSFLFLKVRNLTIRHHYPSLIPGLNRKLSLVLWPWAELSSRHKWKCCPWLPEKFYGDYPRRPENFIFIFYNQSTHPFIRAEWVWWICLGTCCMIYLS